MALKRDGLSDVRDAVLAAALPKVEGLGWSERLLKTAAREADVELGMAQIAFPDGAADLLAWYSRSLDDRLRTLLTETDLSVLKVRERVYPCGPYSD